MGDTAGVGVLRRTARWLFATDEPLALQAHETWPCPACDRSVEIEAPSPYLKQRGYWLPPSPVELRAVCARTHRAHRADGSPRPAPEPRDPDARWAPVTIVDGGDGGLPTFVVLVPPAGVAFEAEVDPDGRPSYAVVALEHVEPSVLAGGWDRRHGGGRVVAHVPAADVHLDADGSRVDWDALAAQIRSK